MENEGCLDGNGHGTHVAGTLGGSTYGVAKDVSLVGVKVLANDGSGSNAGIIEAVHWVTIQALNEPNVKRVCNLSLGGNRSRALDRAIKTMIERGHVFTAVAAGNDNSDACAVSPAAGKTVMVRRISTGRRVP